MVTMGYVRLQLVTYGYSGLPMVTVGYIWLHQFTYVTVSSKPSMLAYFTWLHTNEFKTPIVLPIFNCFTPKYS